MNKISSYHTTAYTKAGGSFSAFDMLKKKLVYTTAQTGSISAQPI